MNWIGLDWRTACLPAWFPHSLDSRTHPPHDSKTRTIFHFLQSKLSIADLAVFPVLNWITSSITTPEALAPYPLLSKLMQTIEAHPRVVEYYRLEREREEGKVKEQQAVAAAAVAAGAGAIGGGGH